MVKGYVTLHWRDGFTKSFDVFQSNFRGLRHGGERPYKVTRHIETFNITATERHRLEDWFDSVCSTLSITKRTSQMDKHTANMLTAYRIRGASTCQRRKIGAIFTSAGRVATGVNCSPLSCTNCHRNAGECRAIHAEVNAIQNAGHYAYELGSHLYVWAEVPCSACLSYISKMSLGNCRTVHCLSPVSYAEVYLPIANRGPEIAARKSYALALGIKIVEHDMQELLSHLEE